MIYQICLLTPSYHMYIQYHIVGRHVILMLCLNLMLGPTYLPYFFFGSKQEPHIYFI